MAIYPTSFECLKYTAPVCIGHFPKEFEHLDAMQFHDLMHNSKQYELEGKKAQGSHLHNLDIARWEGCQ